MFRCFVIAFYKIFSLYRQWSLFRVTFFSMDKISRMFSEGYPYSKLNAICEISNDRLIFKEAYVTGDGLDFYCKGSIGLSSKEMDLVVYAHPFKTIDSIVTVIPFVGEDLGGGEKVVTLIPIKVQGRIGGEVRLPVIGPDLDVVGLDVWVSVGADVPSDNDVKIVAVEIIAVDLESCGLLRCIVTRAFYVVYLDPGTCAVMICVYLGIRIVIIIARILGGPLPGHVHI